MPGSPASKRCRTSSPIHKGNHGAQNDQENQNPHIITIGQHTHDAILKHVENRSFKTISGVQQTTDHNTDKQGGIYLLSDQSQGNCYYGRQKGPDGSIKTAALRSANRSPYQRRHNQRRQQDYCQDTRPQRLLTIPSHVYHPHSIKKVMTLCHDFIFCIHMNS